ncbi:MAG: hypothetical protein ACQGVC_05980 [Myxococcota bacterium]
MTLFEYLAAAYTLLVSLAVARLVFGLPAAVVRGRRYWVHLVFVAGFAFSLALSFWSFWSYRDVAWTFPRFLLALASPALALFMASTLVPASPDQVASWRDFYYAVRARYFTAWIAAIVLVVLNTTLLVDMPLAHPARIGQLAIAAIGVVGAASQSARVHAGLAVTLVAVQSFAAWVIFREPGSLAG